MRVVSEEIQREKLSKWCVRLALASFIPLIGITAGIIGGILSVLGLYLGKKYPERFGGLWRLRLSLVLAIIALVLSFFELDAFFRYKIRQAEQARYEITMMRLYEVAEIMENYSSEFGEYPAGSDVDQVRKVIEKRRALFFPTIDGWGRALKLSADPWDYSVTAEAPEKDRTRKFPLLKAQSPKPVFPFVGLYPGTVLEPVQEQQAAAEAEPGTGDRSNGVIQREDRKKD